MERDTVKVTRGFRDFTRHLVTDPKFPIKTVSGLVTLCTMTWLKKYDSASEEEKKLMVEEIRKIQSHAEKKDYLHNSREIIKNE